MEVSQIFLTDANDELSPFLKYATDSVKNAFSGANYTIYNKETLRQFIADNYDKYVLWAYDTLAPYSYKADLGRYCLLNKLGGWYVDIGITIVNPVELGSLIKMLVFRDIQRFSFTGWACAPGILYSQPNSAVLWTAIELIVKNCQEQYYGITPLCPTGPTLFGQALAINRAQTGIIYGDHIELTPNHEQKNRSFVLPDGTIMGRGKPSTGGDLTALGARSVNNYNELWAQRRVYGG